MVEGVLSVADVYFAAGAEKVFQASRMPIYIRPTRSAATGHAASCRPGFRCITSRTSSWRTRVSFPRDAR